MKTYRIPTTDVVITAHNEREERIALIFINDIKITVEAAHEGYKWAKGVCELGGGIEYVAEEMGGYAKAMFHLGMIEKPFSCVSVAEVCRTLYEGGQE